MNHTPIDSNNLSLEDSELGFLFHDSSSLKYGVGEREWQESNISCLSGNTSVQIRIEITIQSIFSSSISTNASGLRDTQAFSFIFFSYQL